MANDNMKKWLAVVTDVPSTATTKGRMLTEDVTGALKDIHSKVLSRPEVSDTPEKIIARVAGGMRGVSKQEVQSGFDALSKKNGFSSFADELKSATGAHDEEMHVAEAVVDEEDMEEGNEFSGALAAAKKQGKKSFEVDGKTYPVKESSEDEEDDEEEEEMLSEEWSVLYDSTYATNMKASVRVQQGMNEEQVREWFSKAFQPLNIHEVSMRSPIDPKDQMSKPFIDPKQDTDPMGVLKPKPGRPKPDKLKPGKLSPPHLMGEDQVDEILAPLAAGARAVGGAIAQGAKAVGSMAGKAVTGMANVAGQAVGAYKQGAQQQGVIGQQQQQQAGQQQQQMPAAGGQPLRPGPIQVDTKKKMVITPVGAIPFTQMITKENRETRDDDLENEILTALSDIHEQLNGDYDLDKQYDVIHSVSESSGISYKDLLEAWVTDSHGMKQALTAAKQSSAEEQPPAEQPPAEEPPAEQPTIGQAPAAPAAPAEQPTIGQAPAEEPAPEEEPVIQPKAKVAESKKKKTKTVIKEAHNVMLDVHDDHEVSMAQADLYRIVKDASALHNMLDNVHDLEGWVQAKITLASDYISKVKDYMEYDMIEANRRNNDPYEDATLFETDDEDSADDADKDKIPHIVMQLRKAKDVDGNHKIKFEDGSSHYVSMTVIKNFLDKHDKIKPAQKDAMSRDAIKSLRHLKAQAEV